MLGGRLSELGVGGWGLGVGGWGLVVGVWGFGLWGLGLGFMAWRMSKGLGEEVDCVVQEAVRALFEDLSPSGAVTAVIVTRQLNRGLLRVFFCGVAAISP
jgi:hypothetical protein